MKQKRFLWIVLLSLFLLCSCADQKQSEPTDVLHTKPETAPTQPEIMDESRYPEVLECATAEGFVTQESIDINTPCQVRLTKHRVDENASGGYSYDLYIEVDTGTEVLKKELETCVSTLPADSVFLGDVDGDGTQEILIHNNTGGCGGFGLWRTWVLKVEGDEIRILLKNFDEFDTGFESRFLEGYQLEVKNRITGYTLVFDVKDSHREYIANATEMPDGNIFLDPFYVFEPKDVDDDGISEVICKEYTSIFSHADYTGSACSVLKFNKKTQVFEVVDAWYEPETEEQK